MRSTGGADAFRESKGFGASYLGVPAGGVSQYGGLAGSPSRHQDSLTRSRVEVTRELFQRSENRSPSRYEYSSPSRRTETVFTSSHYGADRRRLSPLKQDDEEELVRAFKE